MAVSIATFPTFDIINNFKNKIYQNSINGSFNESINNSIKTENKTENSSINDSINYNDTNKILIINSSEETLLTVKSLGFNYDNIAVNNISSTNLTRYDAIIVDNIETKLNREEVAIIKNASDKGVNILWIGYGIGGYDNQTLPSMFGIMLIQEPTTDENENENENDYETPTQTPSKEDFYVKWNEHKISFDENIPIELKGASAESYIYDNNDSIAYPAITYYQKNTTPSRLIYIAYNSYDVRQYSVLVHYIQAIITKPVAILNPYPNKYKSAVLVRIEDINSREVGPDYVNRLRDTIYWLGSNRMPTNLAVIPVFVNGSEKADNMHTWRKDFSVDDTSNLRNVLSDAIYKFNGYIITHGYTHQYGNGPEDYSGTGQEFFDEVNKTWLKYSEQYDRIKKAREEIQMTFPEENITTINIDYSCTTINETFCWTNKTNSYTKQFELDSKYLGYSALLYINYSYDRPNIWINGKELSTSWLENQQYSTEMLHVTSDYFVSGINNITINTDTKEGANIEYINITFIKGFNSTIFEPPHYVSNKDTYLAEKNLSYRNNMADEYIYPNNLLLDGLLNIPETGDNISIDIDQKEIDFKIEDFKAIYDGSGIYLIFYHAFTDNMHKGFKSIMNNIFIYRNVWYPNIGELADWWEGRDKIVFNSIRDDNDKKVTVNIKSNAKTELKNVTMKFILPYNANIVDIKLDNKSIDTNSNTEIINTQSQFVYVTIPTIYSNERHNIVLSYS